MSTLLNPGDRWAGHEILRHVGTGRSAEVYAARAPSGELRALKIMTVKAALAAKLAARFAQEGEALASIVHPNVVRFHDAGAWGDHLWLSLELVEGETLGQKLRAGRRLPLGDVLSWMMQACAGLAEAHAVGVIHRALTPDELVITPCGTVKVIDFGLAKLCEWGVDTTHEERLGSARYMAPEQTQGAPASAAMDVYAIGHILYEATAGVHAMGAEPRPMIGVVAWQLGGQPRPLREIAPWVPSDVEALAHEALAKDPARRPASMRALVARLRDAETNLRAPQRRAARNASPRQHEGPLAPTMPMPAHDAPAGTFDPTASAEMRSTDTPVESAAVRPSMEPRRSRAALLVAVAATLAAAAGWMIFERVRGPAPEAGDAPRPAASAAPPASAPPSPTAVPAATASASPPASASAAVPPRTPPRHAPAPRGPTRAPVERPPAKNRLFGAE